VLGVSSVLVVSIRCGCSRGRKAGSPLYERNADLVMPFVLLHSCDCLALDCERFRQVHERSVTNQVEADN
jgi:hypothetical protein